MFIGLLTSIVNSSNHSTLINLHPNGYSHKYMLRYYSFDIKLDRCVRSYNILNDPSERVSF